MAQRARSVAAGSLYVPISQPHAEFLLALLEPQGPDSVACLGFFNACFEHKEHVEPYVAEQIAREMLAADPALHTEFQRQLEADSQFAANPAARLEFFLRRHASWDDHFNLYPILRTAGLRCRLASTIAAPRGGTKRKDLWHRE